MIACIAYLSGKDQLALFMVWSHTSVVNITHTLCKRTKNLCYTLVLCTLCTVCLLHCWLWFNVRCRTHHLQVRCRCNTFVQPCSKLSTPFEVKVWFSTMWTTTNLVHVHYCNGLVQLFCHLSDYTAVNNIIVGIYVSCSLVNSCLWCNHYNNYGIIDDVYLTYWACLHVFWYDSKPQFL